MMFNSRNKNQLPPEDRPKEDPFYTSDITYENWDLFQKDRHILESRSRTHDGVKKELIWLFYWIGRSDCLYHRPPAYDIIYTILYKEMNNPHSKYIKNDVHNMISIRDLCVQNYISGYQNALRESLHGIVNHPKKALKFKPQNYQDPQFSAHDLMEMKTKL